MKKTVFSANHSVGVGVDTNIGEVKTPQLCCRCRVDGQTIPDLWGYGYYISPIPGKKSLVTGGLVTKAWF